jgi:hypothetical protein
VIWLQTELRGFTDRPFGLQCGLYDLNSCEERV